jgi:hypothetical protein
MHAHHATSIMTTAPITPPPGPRESTANATCSLSSSQDTTATTRSPHLCKQDPLTCKICCQDPPPPPPQDRPSLTCFKALFTVGSFSWPAICSSGISVARGPRGMVSRLPCLRAAVVRSAAKMLLSLVPKVSTSLAAAAAAAAA